MCGIIAVKNEETEINEQLIKNALNVISNRGPDNSAIWLSNNKTTALGHARLSIIDLTSGNQPIINRHHKISIVVNGEFYNYKKIRQDLQKKGYEFNTNSDSEILIFLYLEYGLDLFEHLRGEFAFVLYDENKDLLLAVRDRFGIKPLCYYKDDNRLLIASEAKALFELGIEKDWDEYSFMHAANMHYQPTNRTLFKNIFQLEPGHFLISHNNQFSIKKYWDLDYPKETKAKWIKTEQEYIDEFRELLEESVRLRLISDVPVCFHLSGGLDSSAIVGLSGKYLDTQKHCFTITFGGKENYDEAKLAEDTAKFTNSVLHKIDVSQEDIFNNLENAVYFSEGLAINGHLSCKYLLNKEIKKAGFKVALTGEGSDEVLAGYPHLRQDIFNQMPEVEKKKHIKKLYDTNLAITGVEIAQGDGLNIDSVKQKLGFVPSFLSAKASIGLKINSILSDDLISKYKNIDFYDEMLDSYDIKNQLKGRHIINQSLYLWTKLTLVNYILNTLGDGCEMSSSIEGRLPFLDHKLFEYVKNLPMEMKIKNGVEKYILREAVKPYITEDIYKRQKHPFMAPPVTRFITKQTMDFITDTLKSDSFKNIPFFDSQKINHLLNRLNKMDIVELTAYEPVIMFLMTSALAKKRFGL